MALQALLLSSDPRVLDTLQQVLDRVSIELQVCHGPDEARNILNCRKFDAFLLDCDDMPGATSVLQDLCTGTANKSCVTFAVVNGQTTVRQAYAMGANFVLDKPLSAEHAIRSVRAAQGLVMRERRRYDRHLLRATGTILVDTGTELPVTITTISPGGVSIECARRLDLCGAASLKIFLPGSRQALQAKGEIVWSTEEGRAGIKFLVMSTENRKALESWLHEHGLPLGNHGAMFIDATSSPPSA